MRKTETTKCLLFVAGNKNHIDPILSMVFTPQQYTKLYYIPKITQQNSDVFNP